MPKRTYVGDLGLVFLILAVLCLIVPVAAQMPPDEAAPSGPILRVAVVDVKVQGEQEPAAIRQAFTALLPALADCLQTEYQRVGKVPAKIVLRLNVGGNGKVVWCKVIDPVLKSLEACICSVVPKLQLPASGSALSRATVILESELDHLLAP